MNFDELSSEVGDHASSLALMQICMELRHSLFGRSVCSPAWPIADLGGYVLACTSPNCILAGIAPKADDAASHLVA
jgi:hypothetical protein